MKILVDTSVWSLMLCRQKKSDHPASLFLQKEIENESSIYLTGAIFQEVLQGVRSEAQINVLKKYLQDFSFLDSSLAVHEEAAKLFNLCRSKGIQASTIDCQIAAIAIHYHCHLLTTDKDFHFVARFVPLKLIAF